MSKTIIFCADGTWNGPEERTGASTIEGQDDRGELAAAPVTNVVKSFSNLAGQVTPETTALRNEQEKVWPGNGDDRAQVAKYVHGVGDSQNLILKLLGGALGTGVVARIVRGYTFISRQYDPGDDIHIIGFSRGAYTARALAGMIANVGLLNRSHYDPRDKTAAYRLAIAAWCKSRGAALGATGRGGGLTHHILSVIEGFFATKLSPDGLVPNVAIKSVGVWDTVGSLGIPLYAADVRYDAFRFADTSLSTQVQNGFHAMSIDELRGDFAVTRWDDRPGVSQVWFVGAHSDVGGGYPGGQTGLSDIALDWMARKLSGVGVQWSAPLAYSAETRGFDEAIHQPWASPPFDLLPKTPRQVGSGDVVHRTVVERYQKDGRYRPEALSAVGGGLATMRCED